MVLGLQPPAPGNARLSFQPPHRRRSRPAAWRSATDQRCAVTPRVDWLPCPSSAGSSALSWDFRCARRAQGPKPHLQLGANPAPVGVGRSPGSRPASVTSAAPRLALGPSAGHSLGPCREGPWTARWLLHTTRKQLAQGLGLERGRLAGTPGGARRSEASEHRAGRGGAPGDPLGGPEGQDSRCSWEHGDREHGHCHQGWEEASSIVQPPDSPGTARTSPSRTDDSALDPTWAVH